MEEEQVAGGRREPKDGGGVGGVQKASPRQLGEGDAHEAGEGLARLLLRLLVDAIAPAAPLAQ
jgi:hypothetical protein